MTPSGEGRLEAAKEHAGEVAADARGAAADVKDAAAGNAAAVTRQAASQAHDLVDRARGELETQATAQSRRLGDTLVELGAELRRMADGGEQGGVAAQAVGEAAHQVERLGAHVQGREFADLLDDVRGFARRRPGTFLLGAAGLGLLAGRLGRGMRDAQQEPTTDTAAAGPAVDPYPSESFPAGSISDTAATTPGAPTIEPPRLGRPSGGRGLGGA